MRVVLFNDRRTEREAMLRALPPEAYHVEAVSDEHAAAAAVARQAPQVLVFNVPPKGGADLVRRLKSVDNAEATYFIAIVEAAPAAREFATLVEAGVHDFMRRPFCNAELLERVRAPQRLLSWSRSVLKPSAFDFSSEPDINGLGAWRRLGELVAADLSQMASQAFVVTRGWPADFVHGSSTASIPMTLAGDQLELRVSIVADERALAWVRAALLGEPAASEAATRDALRELANTAGGALKRAALSESVTLTTGLPVDDSSIRFPGIHNCWSLRLEADAGCLAVVGEIRKLSNERIPASLLTEGMVVAHDVRSEAGILLIPAGSRLTSTAASRLAQLLGPRVFLEVAPAA